MCGGGSFTHIAVWGMRGSLTHPQVVDDLDGLLEVHWDVHGDVMVEAWPYWEFLWKWRPVVFPAYQDINNSNN